MAPALNHVHKALDPLAIAELEESAMQQVQRLPKAALSPTQNGTHFSHSNTVENQEPLLPGGAGNHSVDPIDHHQSGNIGKKAHVSHGHWIFFMILVWLLFAGIMTALYDRSKRTQQRRCRLHRERRHRGWSRDAEFNRRWEAIAVELDDLAMGKNNDNV
ncbi:hypothetical protein MBLNU457_6667t1 [Dothideomycetes sp. NU457]